MMGASSASRIYGTLQTILICAFAAVVFFAKSAPLFSNLAVTMVGRALCAAGLAFGAAAFISLRNVIQIDPEPRRNGHLVTSGIYRRFRHPIYTAIVVVVVGLFLCRPTLWIAIAALVIIAFLIAKARFEEQLLEARYPAYAEYRQHTLWTILAALILSSALAGCRASGVLPPSEVQAESAGAAGAHLGFTSLGPTHMSDGYPTSGKVNAFAIDPNDPQTIYAASGRGTGLETYSSAGILRTTDGGKSWQRINDGLTDPSGAISSVVNALSIVPGHASTLLAATEYDGIFRSTNRGSSWTNVYRTTQATQFATFGKAVFATSAAGILKSGDNGAHWTVALAATKNAAPVAFGAVEGSLGNAFYTGMSDGSIYALSAGSWAKVGKLHYTAQTGTDGSTRSIHQIAVDPFAPTTVYASMNDGSWDQNLQASTDGGRSWHAVLKKIYFDYGLGTQAIAFSRVFSHRLYVGSDGLLYYITGDGSRNPKASQGANLRVIDLRNIWTTANGADDTCWIASDQGLDDEPTCSTYFGRPNDRVVSSSSATGLARRFTVAPNGKTLLSSLQDFDSHVTSDGGKTWSANFNLYEDGFNELRPGSPAICYAYDEASGLSVSNDGCASFSPPQGMQGQIFPSRLMTTPIAFDPKNPLVMYLASGSILGVGFPPSPKGVFKSTNGGTTLSKLKWPFSAPGAIVVDVKDGGHILVGDLASGASSLSLTTNGGTTWTKSTGVPATPFWYAMTISPVDGRTVLASSVDASNNIFVLRSRDGGRTFRRIATVTNAPMIRARIDADRSLSRLRRSDERARDAETGPAPAFLYSPERQIQYNEAVKNGTADVAITTLRGAYLSSDNGGTWKRLDDALVAHSFWGIRWVGGYLYLGSDGQGVLRSNAPLQTP